MYDWYNFQTWYTYIYIYICCWNHLSIISTTQVQIPMTMRTLMALDMDIGILYWRRILVCGYWYWMLGMDIGYGYWVLIFDTGIEMAYWILKLDANIEICIHMIHSTLVLKWHMGYWNWMLISRLVYIYIWSIRIGIACCILILDVNLQHHYRYPIAIPTSDINI